MPVILVKDYTWRQTPEEIIISVPLKVRPKHVDILAIGNYVKMSYPPFILELILCNDILEESSECTLSEECAVFTLKKAEMGCHWPSLVVEDLSKEKKSEYRAQAMERSQLSAEKRSKERTIKKQELQRQAVREQIDLDTTTYNKIQRIRDDHRKEAMTQFEDWKKKAEMPIVEEQGVVQENRKSYKAPVKWFESKAVSQENKTRQDEHPVITELHEPEQDEDDSESHQVLTEKNEKDVKRGKEIIRKVLEGKFGSCRKTIFQNDTNNTSTPRPRQSGMITVKFSDRIFPTPARESHHLEEQEWLEKQAEARRKCGFSSEDLRPEEQDPQWLKDKGDEFFKVGNYLAAISAYTHGIKLSDKMSYLYANRSAAQFAVGNFRRCAEDCSTALELMTPKCERNRDSRARCHARLGAALCKLSAPQHGIPEFEEALKLAPNNVTIQRDLEQARRYFELKED